ncbi:NifB/NifX family molybdenum-iron cluster-binding protein [candidate division KSB1 bacterium]
MKVVLPIYEKRISPVFDWCMKALVVEKLPGGLIKKKEVDLSYFSEIERIKVLENIGTRTLLCGGISMQLEGIFSYLGINVISWISGSVDEILDLYLTGALNPEKIILPGVKKYRAKRCHRNNEISANSDKGNTINLIEWTNNE